MKYKKGIILATVILFVIAHSGSVMAFMYQRLGFMENTFVPASVSCVAEEKMENNIKTSITVKNTGNVDAYVRVRLVSYWVDDNGAIVALPCETPKVNTNGGWIADAKNDTYYCTTPLSPYDSSLKNATSNLLSNGAITLKTKDGYRQVVEVFAEAIQANPTTAAAESWGVTINGNAITAVPNA